MLHFFIKKATPDEIKARLHPVFQAAEKKNQLPPGLLERVAQQESAFRSDIILGTTKSSAGALGLMQIVPRWHPKAKPLSPIHSIRYAAAFLHRLHGVYGRWDYALAAYNWGRGNVSKSLTRKPNNPQRSWPGETRRYVRDILKDVDTNA